MKALTRTYILMIYYWTCPCRDTDGESNNCGAQGRRGSHVGMKRIHSRQLELYISQSLHVREIYSSWVMSEYSLPMEMNVCKCSVSSGRLHIRSYIQHFPLICCSLHRKIIPFQYIRFPATNTVHDMQTALIALLIVALLSYFLHIWNTWRDHMIMKLLSPIQNHKHTQ